MSVIYLHFRGGPMDGAKSFIDRKNMARDDFIWRRCGRGIYLSKFRWETPLSHIDLHWSYVSEYMGRLRVRKSNG